MRLTALLVCVLACAPKSPPIPLAAPAQQVRAFEAPADAQAWYLKAQVAREQGDYAEANRALAWVIRLDRSNPWAWAAKGRLMAERGEWTEAAVAFSQAYSRADDGVDAQISEQICGFDGLMSWTSEQALGVPGAEFVSLQAAVALCGEGT